ncbi:hypothetical protein WJX77_009982 [Trebouxia sp. C0004]
MRRLLLQQHPAVQDKAVATSCPDKTKLLPPAVQASSAGRQQAAALREVLRQEAWAEVTSCVADEKSTSDERAGWVAAARSLIEGCFIEQDTATLLCGYSVTIYVIAHADVDHLQVTKYADPKEPAADFLWLYVTGNRYQLVGPMQQFVVMKAATSTGEDKDFVLAPHGYAVPHGGVAQQAVVHAPGHATFGGGMAQQVSRAGIHQTVASAAAKEASLAPMTGHAGGKRPRSDHEWEEVTQDKARNWAVGNDTAKGHDGLYEDGQERDGEIGHSDVEEGDTAAPSLARSAPKRAQPRQDKARSASPQSASKQDTGTMFTSAWLC